MAETRNELPSHGRVLALDIGVSRIGVAISDPLRITVSPLETIERRGKRDWHRLLKVVREQEVNVIVLGMPYELSGETGEMAKFVVAFRDELMKRLAGDPKLGGVKVETYDERFTTSEAEQYLTGSKNRDGERRSERDRIAAAIILERYLAQQQAPISESDYFKE